MKKHVKTTTCVDDGSQLFVSYSAYFGHIHDSKKFKKTLESMDREIVCKFKIIIGDKGYGSEENHIVAGEHGLFAIIPTRNGDAPIYRTKGETGKG